MWTSQHQIPFRLSCCRHYTSQQAYTTIEALQTRDITSRTNSTARSDTTFRLQYPVSLETMITYSPQADTRLHFIWQLDDLLFLFRFFPLLCGAPSCCFSAAVVRPSVVRIKFGVDCSNSYIVFGWSPTLPNTHGYKESPIVLGSRLKAVGQALTNSTKASTRGSLTRRLRARSRFKGNSPFLLARFIDRRVESNFAI